MFSAYEILSPGELVACLLAPHSARSIQHYVVSKLSAATLDVMRCWAPGQPTLKVRSALAGDFAKIVRQNGFYAPERFADVHLSSKTQQWLDRQSAGSELIQMNRMLLRDALPGILLIPKTFQEFALEEGVDIERVLKAANDIGIRNAKAESVIEDRLAGRLQNVVSTVRSYPLGGIIKKLSTSETERPDVPRWDGANHFSGKSPVDLKDELQRCRLAWKDFEAKLDETLKQQLRKPITARSIASISESMSRLMDVHSFAQVAENNQLMDILSSSPKYSQAQNFAIMRRLTDQHVWLSALEAQGSLTDFQTRLLQAYVESFVDFLHRLCVKNDLLALQILIELSLRSANAVEDLKIRNPKHVDELSRKFAAWPSLKSKHPKFTQSGPVPLNLGEALPYEFNENSRWNPKSLRGALARLLIEGVAEIRKSYDDTGYQKLGRLIAGPLYMEACELPPLSRYVAQEWWEVAKGLFLEEIPEPEEHDILRALSSTAKRPARYSATGQRRKVDGKIRQEIIEAVRLAFFSAVGAHVHK